MLGSLEFAQSYPLTIVVVGFTVLGVAALLRPLGRTYLTYPLVVLSGSIVVFALVERLPTPSPQQHNTIAVHLTEIGVIVSLMGVGLKIDRVPNWRTWSTVWRLLAVTMPITIVVVAALAWWTLGLPIATAILLGAVVAPTDPVLASDVQVGEPLDAVDRDPAEEQEEELRFALTSEAGLNDALAFPFVYLAIRVATNGVNPGGWAVEWLAVDWLYRIVIGVAVGAAGGWMLARVLLALPGGSQRDRALTGVGALAGTLLLYGLTEVVEGYGFLAVFVGAITLRHCEHTHETHRALHVFAEQTEQLLMAGILLALGGAIARGILAPLTLAAVALAVVIVLAVRPIAGFVALVGSSRVGRLDRRLIAFFG